MSHSVLVVYVILGREDEIAFRDSQNQGAEYPDIGLFKVRNAVTEEDEWALIYAEDEIHGNNVADLKYATGFLAKGGIGEISESGSFKHGGGVIQSRQTQIRLNNTAQLKSTLEGEWIRLFGRMVYIIEYSWDKEYGKTELPKVEVNPLFAGRVEEVQWNEAELRLSAVPNIEMQRRANVMIDGLPVTIGELKYGINTIENEPEKILGNLYLDDANEFSTPSGLLYRMLIETAVTQDEFNNALNYLNSGLFCVADGTEAAIKVKDISFDNDSNLQIVLYEKFSQDKIPVYVDIYVQTNSYVSDRWPNSVGSGASHDSLPMGMNRAYFINSKNILQEILPYGEIIDTKRGTLLPIQASPFLLRRGFATNEWSLPKLLSVNSFWHEMVANVRELEDRISKNTRLKSWSTINNAFNGYSAIAPGVYVRQESGTAFIDSHSLIPENGGNILDGKIDTKESMGYSLRPNGYAQTCYGIEFDINNPNEFFDFDSAYLSIKMNAGLGEHWRFGGAFIRFKNGNNVHTIWEADINLHPVFAPGDYLEFINDIKIAPPISIPMSPQVSSGNTIVTNSFLANTNIPFDKPMFSTILSGYKNGQISNIDFRKSIPKKLLVSLALMPRPGYPLYSYSRVVDVDIYDVGVVYKKEVDVSRYVIMPTYGRVFNDFWHGRRDILGYIDNPVDAIEHFRRLSNWSETKIGKPHIPCDWKGWGKTYAPDGFRALIDTDSFDNPALNEVKGLTIGGQILKENEANNDAIVKELCEDFYIISRKTIPTRNKTTSEDIWFGSTSPPDESISCLYTPGSNFITKTITLKELISYGDIREPGANDIFCEPILKYEYIEGIGYNKTMAVRNIVTHEWPDNLGKDEEEKLAKVLAPGFTLEDGREIWRRCKSIYNRYRAFAEMPTSLSEQRWIQNYDTALWKMKSILDWQQFARTQIVVPWSIGRFWNVGTHIELSLPHVRGCDELLCVCESVKKTKYANRVTCDLIFLQSVNESGAFITIQETGNADIVIDESGGRLTNISEMGNLRNFNI